MKKIAIYYGIALFFALVTSIVLIKLDILVSSPLGILIIALCYMPSPLYATWLTSKILGISIRWKVKVSKKAVLTASGIFLTYNVVQFLLLALLRVTEIKQFGTLHVNSAEVINRMSTVYSQFDSSIVQLPPIIVLFVLSMIAPLLAGFTINGFFAYTEEIGWRGFLLEAIGKRTSLEQNVIIGTMWGFWHAPLIYLLGYNYPDQRILGVFMFIGICISLSVLLNQMKKKYDSIAVPAILHGAFNAGASFTMLLTTSNHSILGPVVGVIGLVSLWISYGIWRNTLKKVEGM